MNNVCWKNFNTMLLLYTNLIKLIGQFEYAYKFDETEAGEMT